MLLKMCKWTVISPA